jgi:hypothetical protein
VSRSRLLDPDFKWIPAATHDADSTEFRKRQRARMAAAEKAREEAAKKVAPIKRKQA